MTTDGERVDVLIVTAIKLEYDELLKVTTGAVGSWIERPGPTGFKVAFCDFAVPSGATLRIAATPALDMGGVATASAAAPLVHTYQPRCLAMSGVCAGRRGDVRLGDVIIADKLWTYDTGATVVETDDDGRTHERFKADPATYNLHAKWLETARTFRPSVSEPWLADRPRSYDDQGDWLMARLLAGENPREHQDRPSRCADFAAVVKRLRERGWLAPTGLALTDAGRAHIDDRVMLHPDGLPERESFTVHVGPIGTGTRVVRDAKIFDKLSVHMRKVLGLEMEAAAIGAIAHQHDVERMIVMKGVMDHADPDKNDNFKHFAARASAECLIAFLRQNLPPRAQPDPVLVPGTSDLPPKVGTAALLNARHQIVKFFGRTDLRADLAAWCEGDAPARARLIHAAGGMGKTRLLIQLCQDMQERGFHAGFVPTGLDPARFADLVHRERPTLAVIDYANSRTDLRALLAPVLRLRNQGGAARVRVVLLARGKGDWWEAALRSEVGDLLRDEEPLELLPLAVKGEERERMFREAVAYFAEHRKKQPVSAPAPPLDAPHYDRTLFVHMAALATVDGYSFSADTLMSDTLDHEERFWSQAFALKSDREERQKVRVVRRAVTAITLRGGASDEPEAEELIERISGARDPDLVMVLRDLYPGGAAFLAGLEPDLLGEAMVHRTLSEEGKSAVTLLDRAFETADDRAIKSGFEVLGRISGDHREAEVWIAHVLDGDVVARAEPAFAAALTIAVEDPIKERAAHTRLGMALAKALEAKGTVEIAKRLEGALPNETVALREVALWVTETRLTHLPAGTEPEQFAERARLLNNLGARQSALGRREDALSSTEEAVAIRRKLAEARPEAFLPDLATSLNNLGIRQSELGRREDALASTEEAVATYRKLAEARPEAFLPDLAMSLNNLGVDQSAQGRREDALASTEAALEAIWPFFLRLPAAFASLTGTILDNLRECLQELGREPSPELLERMELFQRTQAG